MIFLAEKYENVAFNLYDLIPFRHYLFKIRLSFSTPSILL